MAFPGAEAAGGTDFGKYGAKEVADILQGNFIRITYCIVGVNL
jgi:hypothetical protein